MRRCKFEKCKIFDDAPKCHKPKVQATPNQGALESWLPSQPTPQPNGKPYGSINATAVHATRPACTPSQGVPLRLPSLSVLSAAPSKMLHTRVQTLHAPLGGAFSRVQQQHWAHSCSILFVHFTLTVFECTNPSGLIIGLLCMMMNSRNRDGDNPNNH